MKGGSQQLSLLSEITSEHTRTAQGQPEGQALTDSGSGAACRDRGWLPGRAQGCGPTLCRRLSWPHPANKPCCDSFIHRRIREGKRLASGHNSSCGGWFCPSPSLSSSCCHNPRRSLVLGWPHCPMTCLCCEACQQCRASHAQGHPGRAQVFAVTKPYPKSNFYVSTTDLQHNDKQTKAQRSSRHHSSSVTRSGLNSPAAEKTFCVLPTTLCCFTLRDKKVLLSSRNFYTHKPLCVCRQVCVQTDVCL